MWNPTELGLATWTADGWSLQVDARGGSHGISFSADGSPLVSIAPVDQDRLPSAAEQYVRGDQWHVNYPQGDSSYALRLSLAMIQCQDSQRVLEVCVSIQTDLMDLHPKLDIDIDCQDIDSLVPTNPLNQDQVTGSGTAPISIAKGSSGSTTVLLGPHDHPFTSNHSTDMRMRLRLFGEFLEKGVIRKARPWIVLRDNQPFGTKDLEDTWQRLNQSPLPLTS